MDNFKTVSSDKENLVGVGYIGNLKVNYKAKVYDTELVVTVDDDNPIISSEVYNGIAQREVNELKVNK